MKIKKLTLIILSVVMLAVAMPALSGCGKNYDLEVFIFAQSHEQAQYNSLKKLFEEKTGKKVKIRYDNDTYYQVLTGDLSNANTTLDVFYIRPGDVISRVANKNVLDLTPYIQESELEGVYSEVIDFYRFDKATKTFGTGAIYALPKDYSQYALGFNNSIIEANRSKISEYIYTDDKAPSYAEWAGKDLEIITMYNESKGIIKVKLPGFPGEQDADGNDIVYTYDEFGALTKICSTFKFNSKDVLQPSGTIFGAQFWENMCLKSYVWGAGGSYLKNNHTEVNFTSPEFIEGYQGFMDLPWKWSSVDIAGSSSGYNKFVEGKVAFMPVGSWDIGYFFKEAELDVKLMPWPISNKYAGASMTDRQDKWFGRADSIGYGVTSKCKNPELAVEFIKFLSINRENQKTLAMNGCQIPNFIDMADEYVNDSKYPLPKESKELLLKIVIGKNAMIDPNIYTYNSEWYDEFLSDASKTVWSTNAATRYTVARYCEEKTSQCQAKLNSAISIQNEKLAAL